MTPHRIIMIWIGKKGGLRIGKGINTIQKRGQNNMVMQYLVTKNDEYGRHVKTLDAKLEKIVEILDVLQYNILEIQMYLKNSNTESDDGKKEVWFEKYGKKV